jgi:hypothetical protein
VCLFVDAQAVIDTISCLLTLEKDTLKSLDRLTQTITTQPIFQRRYYQGKTKEELTLNLETVYNLS